jgi:hypothetical protein
LRLTERRETEGESYYRRACRVGWEGGIAKNADCEYVSRRTPDWLKFKCLHAEINEALTIDGPAIVDGVVAPDEMPNLPHVDLATVGRYAVAKVKEAVLAVTGA